MDLITILVLAIGTAITVALGRAWLGARSTWIVLASLVAHIVSAVGQVVLTTSYYEGGDMLLYHETGAQFASWVRTGPDSALGDLWSVLFGIPTPLPFHVIGMGDSTGSMAAFAGLVQLVVGSNLLAVCFAVAVLSLVGKMALARAMQVGDWTLDRWVVGASLLTPSLVFWTSGLLKESLAVVGLGFLMMSARAVVDRRFLSLTWSFPIGAMFVSISKPYVFFACIVAAGIWYYRRRNEGLRLRPSAFVLSLGAASIGLVVLGEYFPRYRLDAIVDTTAQLQQVGVLIEGGSNYRLVDESTGADAARQMLFAPLALATAMFRPLLFEVTNLPMFVSALETSVLLAVALRAWFALGLRNIYREIADRPVLAMSAVFVMIFGVAVGLSTTNMGTLSRYRVPMMPFLVVLMASLDHQRRLRQTSSLARQRVEGRLPAA